MPYALNSTTGEATPNYFYGDREGVLTGELRFTTIIVGQLVHGGRWRKTDRIEVRLGNVVLDECCNAMTNMNLVREDHDMYHEVGLLALTSVPYTESEIALRQLNHDNRRAKRREKQALREKIATLAEAVAALTLELDGMDAE